ncbi:hypothetical protein AYK81_28695 [Bacillus thuringiensis]|uniref:restriction endonuclease subunit S n=1 Tax=unclassified Bacillus cereus group TaxID=2750818 RepID=UPI000775BB6B|nr:MULTISPECIES: restriction endonuclease subunit S [unclassified Bacillus cereus group]KXO03072.1 hypothetical protein AYK81_28695 [Bacillus thuringiensis]MDA2215995.1 restriction endonuclease subunit S [Bacillus cereus group sp. Bc228]MDA2227741.1 restriction endonuclease subunit S [Bacillus cereus group sp. Bc227]
MQKIKIGELLKRIKESIVLEDASAYKRVTIRSKNQGITLRDVELGVNIGTKKQFLIREGQFLLSKIDARNGAFGIVSEKIDGAIITGNFWTFEVNRELLNIEWFNIFVSSPYFIDICSKASSGTTNRQYLDEKKFLNFEIQLPFLQEQVIFVERYKSIKGKFEEVSNELVTQQRNAQKLRGSILQEAIQGKLVQQDENDEPASVLLEKIKVEKERLIKEKKIKKEKPLPQILDEEKPFELPKGWEWVRFSDIGELARGKSKHRPRNDKRLFENGIYPFIQTGDVSKSAVYIDSYKTMYSEFGLAQSRLWERGTLCITIAANIAETAILNIKACFPDSVVGFTPYAPIPVEHNLYFYYVINTVKKRLEEFAPATAQKNINLSILNEVVIPLPPLKEQKRIIEKVNQLMLLCDELEANIEQSKQESEKLMKAVLQEAVTVKEEVLN